MPIIKHSSNKFMHRWMYDINYISFKKIYQIYHQYKALAQRWFNISNLALLSKFFINNYSSNLSYPWPCFGSQLINYNPILRSWWQTMMLYFSSWRQIIISIFRCIMINQNIMIQSLTSNTKYPRSNACKPKFHDIV